MENLLTLRQKQFRTGGLVMFIAAIGLLIARILATLLSGVLPDLVLSALFSLFVQVVCLLIVPFFVYKFALKLSFSGVLEHSNVRKPNPWVMLLCIPLGVCCLFVTLGVSTIWQSWLIMLGYTHSSSSAMPATFSVGLFILEIILTGVLPGVCEEFTNRGGIVTALRGSFTPAQTIVLGGVIFGLFHQNITQVFYTFCFGMLMTALTLKTKSIFPAMLVHFMNNTLSVYIDFSSAYGLPFGGMISWINDLLLTNFLAAVGLWVLSVAAAVGVFYAILRICKKQNASAAAHDDGIVILSAEGEELDRPSELPLENKMLYKPVLRDWAFYIGAAITMLLTTIFTFTWGLL